MLPVGAGRFFSHFIGHYSLAVNTEDLGTKLALLNMNRLSKTESTIFVSLMGPLLPEELQSELILFVLSSCAETGPEVFRAQFS